MSRRASSNVQAPHRGEFFYVDDALSEVEADQAERQSSYAPPPTIRRRTVMPSLSRVQSSRDDRDIEEDRPSQTTGIDLPEEQDQVEAEGEEVVDDDMDEETPVLDEDDDDDLDSGSRGSKKVDEKTWKPRVYKWKLERKR